MMLASERDRRPQFQYQPCLTLIVICYEGPQMGYEQETAHSPESADFKDEDALQVPAKQI